MLASGKEVRHLNLKLTIEGSSRHSEYVDVCCKTDVSTCYAIVADSMDHTRYHSPCGTWCGCGEEDHHRDQPFLKILQVELYWERTVE
jgi:hypothetical protein